jgi:phosphoribosyl-ATP pyrophosphohydrolase
MSDPIDRLFSAVKTAKLDDPARSRTAKLVQGGMTKMSKKLVEEAAEAGLDAVKGDRDAVVRESADLIYNLVVLWDAIGIAPADVWQEMERREKLYGIAEKLQKTELAALVSAQAANTQDFIAADPPAKRSPTAQTPLKQVL